MTVLVIGGTGFVGGAVASLLAANGSSEVVVLSRSGGAPPGTTDLRGDVTADDLGLGREAAGLAGRVTHIVSCFGSVDWDAGPLHAERIHRTGTENVVRFAGRCPQLVRLVHLSSILQFGRMQGTVGNREQDMGQEFRTWYEYGKYLAERTLRENPSLPWRVVRVGPVLGVRDGAPPPAGLSLTAALPYLLRGYPAPLARGGAFPCYPCDVNGLAAVLARALEDHDSGDTWTWFDRRMPSMAQVLTGLCSAWGTVPRLVSASRGTRRVAGLFASGLGLPQGLLEYAEPWVDIPVELLDELPPGLPECEPGYIKATSAALREGAEELLAA
jgi:nucleoside-diphosphate-sugar epimerase